MKRLHESEISDIDEKIFKKHKLTLPIEPMNFSRIHTAIATGDIEILKQLEASGSLIQTVCGYTLMDIAAACGQIKTMQWLKDKGYSVDTANTHGFTPLYVAAVYGEIGSVEWLLKNGAKIQILGNFKLIGGVLLQAEKIIIIGELINWSMFADGICNHNTVINPINVSSNSYDSLFIARIKYNLLKNGLKTDYNDFLEGLEKCDLPNALIEAIKTEITPLVSKTQLDILRLEATLMHQIDGSESVLPLHELLTSNTVFSGKSVEKALELCSISYPKSSYYIRKYKAGTITNSEKTILNELLKNEAGGYLINIPKDQLMIAIAQTPALYESINLLLNNALLNIYTKYCLLDALRKHEDNMSNPVVKVAYQAQESLTLKIDEWKRKNTAAENKCNNLENLLSKITDFLSMNNPAFTSFIVDQDNILELAPVGVESNDSSDC